MARMNCRCGEVLSTNQVPNNIQLKVYTDFEWDKIIDHETLDPLTMPRPKYDVWRCPRCERLYFFDWAFYTKPVKVYCLEENFEGKE